MTTSYHEFLRRKSQSAPSFGFEPYRELNDALFPFQRDIVKWALRRGRAAVFADCGLGKSLMELEWANHVNLQTHHPVMILTPLAVAQQFKREGDKFGIPVNVCRTQDQALNGINVTNYEMLPHFNPAFFDGVILDESSILKNFSGKMKQEIIEAFSKTPYRLAATATPAPNDHMELGNHAEFLGVMSRTEMLAEYFTHDGGDTSKWRLKGHAVDAFWKWVSQWAVGIRRPSDLGYPDAGYDLPPMLQYDHEIDCDTYNGTLFPEAAGIQEQRKSKRNSLALRVQYMAQLVAEEPDEPWLIWGELNEECDELEKSIPGAVQVSGSDKPDAKEAKMLGFTNGKIRVLVSKPSVCGFGMNWQQCARVGWVGITNSYEQTYQGNRRCWRFGQEREVHVHYVFAPAEAPILRNLRRKEKDAIAMQSHMIACLSGKQQTTRQTNDYNAHSQIILPDWIKP